MERKRFLQKAERQEGASVISIRELEDGGKAGLPEADQLSVFWQVTEATSNFRWAQKKTKIKMEGCALVCVFVMCSSLVSGGFRCPKHKYAVCFWLCYAGVCLIMLSDIWQSPFAA